MGSTHLPPTFDPREEPGALAAHAGICAGGEEKSSSLPRPFGLFTIEAGRAVQQVRAGYQSADRPGAGPRNSADAARPRRRGDRVERFCCTCSRQVMALLRHGGRAAECLLFGEERKRRGLAAISQFDPEGTSIVSRGAFSSRIPSSLVPHFGRTRFTAICFAHSC